MEVLDLVGEISLSLFFFFEMNKRYIIYSLPRSTEYILQIAVAAKNNRLII